MFLIKQLIEYLAFFICFLSDIFYSKGIFADLFFLKFSINTFSIIIQLPNRVLGLAFYLTF